MALVDRARAMILTPAQEWPLVAIEPTAVGALYSGYIVPLAAIPAICGAIGGIVLSTLFLHQGVVGAVVGALMQFVLALVGVAIIALVAESLAPSFDGVKNREQSFKWIAYAYSAAWVAGIALLVPVIGSLVALAGGIYSLYVLYLGAQPMMAIPQPKAVGYVVVVVLVAIVINVVLAFATIAVVGALAAGAALTSGVIPH